MTVNCCVRDRSGKPEARAVVRLPDLERIARPSEAGHAPHLNTKITMARNAEVIKMVSN